jgi:hypothetical protein
MKFCCLINKLEETYTNFIVGHNLIKVQGPNLVRNVMRRRNRKGNINSEMLLNILTPWLMEPEGSMPHSQRLSNNPHPEPNHPNLSYL